MSKERLFGSMAALACLALGGCATTSSDPSALIPVQVQASVLAEDRILDAENGGKGVSVEEMLARARRAGGGGGGGSAQVASADHASAPPPTAAAQVSAQPAPPKGDAARAASAPAEPAEPKPLFEITYDGSDDQPPAPAAEALAKKLKAARLPAKTEVTILAGPGPGTTAFDQALLANRRARNIRSLLPEGWKIGQVYDPTFPPDTVRIVLGPGS